MATYSETWTYMAVSELGALGRCFSMRTLALAFCLCLLIASPLPAPIEKEGPLGSGPEQVVPGQSAINYTIHFELRSDAAAPAQTVLIVDDLDPALDWATVCAMEVAVGGSVEGIVSAFGCAQPPIIELRLPSGVDLTVGLHEQVGRLTWFLEGPSQGDPGDGFLPPGGGGWVAFSVRPHLDLAEGTEIQNEAQVFFDGNPPVLTNTWTNRVSFLLPGRPQNPFPPDRPTDLVAVDSVLCWDPSIRADDYKVYLWKRGLARPIQPSATTQATCWTPSPPLEPGVDYRWQVVARNPVGTAEGDEWRFTTAGGSPPDPPIYLSPLDGSVNVALSGVELSWNPAERATDYTVFLWPDGQARPQQPVATVSETFLDVSGSVEGGKLYRWQVEARNAQGSALGEEWTFSTASDEPKPFFRRGDGNADGGPDLADAIFVLSFLFLGGGSPPCLDSADTDDNGQIDLTDPVFLLRNLFLGGPGPPAPGLAACGADPTKDDLGCVAYDRC